jgi:fructokinase
MKKNAIVTLGELLIDMFPDEVGKRVGEVSAFIPKPGGAPANVAVAASRLGKKTAFIGKLGEDLFGSYLKKVLEDEGVFTGGISFDPDARTTMAIIAMPDENSAEFVFYRNPGADQRLSEADLDLRLLDSAQALHFGSVSMTDEPSRSTTFLAAKEARKRDLLVSFDVNYRPTLWKDPDDALTQIQEIISHVNLLKVNEAEAALLTDLVHLDVDDLEAVGNAASQLCDKGPEIVVITLGAAGSYFQIREGGAYIPPFRVATVDAVGCGDAFVAGLLTRLVSGQSWQHQLSLDQMRENLRFANAVGALTSLKRGTIPAMPYLAEVEEFLKSQ